MGLTAGSVGRGALDDGLTVGRRSPDDRVIALAGNPNVGKSTLFNALTGLHQHTGNWPGKTVTNAQGFCQTDRHGYVLVDIPGTYSLLAHSAEEEVARDFVCFGAPDAVVAVCDATCLERNLNLVLQIQETGRPLLVCLNLMDEAGRRGLCPDPELLGERLGVPVIGTVARRRRSLRRLTEALDDLTDGGDEAAGYGGAKTGCAGCAGCARAKRKTPPVTYHPAVETAVAALLPYMPDTPDFPAKRWTALRFIEGDPVLQERILAAIPAAVRDGEDFIAAHAAAETALREADLTGDRLRDHLVTAVVDRAHAVADGICRPKPAAHGGGRDGRGIDRIVTGRWFAYPLMVALLLGVFWLTLVGANAPSRLLTAAFDRVLAWMRDGFFALGAPAWLEGALVEGAARVLATVVAVMLPPMAIFFPLFTLMEDVGLLPRIAFNLDRPFQRCRACGKQALTMCMGFGCNAAGVVGCRIIDSPRERLLAVLTNAFVPCNGRFPTLTALLTVFFVGTAGGSSLSAALLLTAVILLGVLVTFAVTRLLSATVLKGVPSSFVLELPPYRLPRIGSVIVHSLLDRTVFVLGRAAAVAAPAGLLLWILANVPVGGASLLAHAAAFLDPAARLIGLDGMILLAFILGFPANEIVLPILFMGYLAQGVIGDVGNLDTVRDVLLANGWTVRTAVCMVLFSLFHWPCSTTLLTVRRETGSRKWTAVAALLPTAVGAVLCAAVNAVMK